MPREYTYGPFQSRRLKLSLGIDVLPRKKICTYDCVYCEIGPTKDRQLVSPKFRLEAPPSSNFRKELISILKYVPNLNSITFGYNGEPTLNKNLIEFYEIAKGVREKLEWTNNEPQLTLFTNSSTLHFEDVMERVKQFDLVLAKLDAGDDGNFQRLNQPHKDSPNMEVIIDSLVKLKNDMPKSNKLAIQCLVCNSYRDDFISNDNPNNIKKLANAIKRIKPDLVQLYSIARIPAQYFVFAISEERKEQLVKEFKEIISDENIKINYY